MLMKNYRIVITLHELPSIAGELERTKKSALTPEKLVRGLRLSLLLRGLFLFDAIIVHTYEAKQMLVDEYNISPKKIEIIPHGSESEVRVLPSKVARKMLGLDPKKKIILCFGFIRPYKGYEFLLEAVSKIPKTMRDGILVFIVGDFHPNSIEIDNKYFRSLCETVKRLGLDGNVRFDVGFVPEEKIHVYFSSADAVAMPYTDCLASGIFHLAAGYGKPMIASAAGELKSLDQDMVVQFSPNDVVGLRDAVVNMISKSDPERADMGNSLRAFSEKSFSWSITANKTLALYNRLLQRHNEDKKRGLS
jgi:glycosyltransferase involved in cell wall biosynthesis